MPNPNPTTDITIRGGLINYPDSRKPIPPPRHQPDTPQTKKPTKTRPDHIHAPAKQPQEPEPTAPEPETDPTD